jgi:hypothetical protein
MMIFAAEHWTSYQIKLFDNILKKLDITGAWVKLPFENLGTEAYDREGQFVMIISSKATAYATKLMTTYPWLQIVTIKRNLDDIIGLTKSMDSLSQHPPERQQIRRFIIEYSKGLQPSPETKSTLDMPKEILLAGGDTLKGWLDEHQDPIILCKLTDSVTVGVYKEEAPGWHPVEFTRGEVDVLASLMYDLDAKITTIKDVTGQQFTL